ncbi:hypothetical protein [Hymenobacter lapidiphilus]|uniref:Uncharacterized protein n=1 Tax=Hymenobacter lapidiphilus TaxID=2608003 RepID=A0A7Y7U5P8_9BACT|nr:hypothetical protein [Hymenobacter lapidiphilus]NVO30690.1 hypothetical protein [Hymenobacter lapidiphilus]
MKPTAQRITDRYPHLRDGAERRQMLVRNAVASAQIEGIQPDEARLRVVVQQVTPEVKGL